MDATSSTLKRDGKSVYYSSLHTLYGGFKAPPHPIFKSLNATLERRKLSEQKMISSPLLSHHRKFQLLDPATKNKHASTANSAGSVAQTSFSSQRMTAVIDNFGERFSNYYGKKSQIDSPSYLPGSKDTNIPTLQRYARHNKSYKSSAPEFSDLPTVNKEKKGEFAGIGGKPGDLNKKTWKSLAPTPNTEVDSVKRYTSGQGVDLIKRGNYTPVFGSTKPAVAREESKKVVNDKMPSVAASRNLFEAKFGTKNSDGSTPKSNQINKSTTAINFEKTSDSGNKIPGVSEGKKELSASLGSSLGDKVTDSLKRNKEKYSEDQNWLLKDRGPSLRSSALNSSNITLIPSTQDESNKSSLRIKIDGTNSGNSSAGNTLRTEVLTSGQLRLMKSSSVGNNVDRSGDNISEELQFRRFSSRKPVFDVFDSISSTKFPQNRGSGDKCCCHCIHQEKHQENGILETSVVIPDPDYPMMTSSPVPEVEMSGISQILPGVPSLRISGAADESVDSENLFQDTSVDPNDSSFENDQSFTPIPAPPSDAASTVELPQISRSVTPNSTFSLESAPVKLSQYCSCPDLLENCMQCEWHNESVAESEPKPHFPAPPIWSTLGGRARNKAKAKRRPAEWQVKPLKQWTLDDILSWLQYLKMDDVASILIGYDVTGEDVEKWDSTALQNLGILDTGTQDKLFRELKALKHTQKVAAKKKRHLPSQKVPLFNLVRSSSYDQILALEVSLTGRDLSVAEGLQGALYVTRINRRDIPLQEGDCILEVNGRPSQAMAAVDFTKSLSRSINDSMRLVLLRRNILSEDSRSISAPLCPPSPSLSQNSSTSSQELSHDHNPLMEVKQQETTLKQSEKESPGRGAKRSGNFNGNIRREELSILHF